MNRHRPIQERTIYVDARCLQDLDFRDRGIGIHVASVLRGHASSDFRDASVVGVLDPALPELPVHLRPLFSETTFCLNPVAHPEKGDIFIQSSPMTHDVGDTWSFRAGRGILSAAIVFDFIPYDWPGYLATRASRIDYLASLARLCRYDCFFPISHYAARRLEELTGVSRQRTWVTGAAVRESLVAAARKPAENHEATRKYALFVGGQDQRKNLDAALAAVRMVRTSSIDIGLRVVGNYTDDFRKGVLAACPDDWLSFLPNVTDEHLAGLYSGAAACIVPSFIEGFSLPVVEAAECGCPVLASDCDAHLELVSDPAALFPAEDPAQLAARLHNLLADPGLRARITSRQAGLAGQFQEQRVSERFWAGMSEAFLRTPPGSATFSLVHGRLPRLAFLSPYPPDQSGVARFSEHTLAAAGKRFEVSLYTDAPGPLDLPPLVRHAGSLSPAPIIAGAYETVLLVIGNSYFHNPILDIAERLGGPAILHDSRMTQIYHDRLGRDDFKSLAGRLLHRSVSDTEVDRWLNDLEPATLFFEPILTRCAPVIVHSLPFQKLLQDRYAAPACVVPFPPNTYFSSDDLAGANRRRVRQKLGLPDGSFVISTFGHVASAKAPAMCIVALELLRAWKIPAKLYFVGAAGGYVGELQRVARQFGVADHVHCFEHYISEETYRDYLIASDAAIQLRTHAFGQLSAALADCASAGLPTIAPSSLVNACRAPAYCRGLAELHSPVQLAEALAEAADEAGGYIRESEARAAYLRENSFGRYVDALAEVLGYG